MVSRPNESVSSRAVTGGMTIAAAIRVTPTTFMQTTIVAASASANPASTQRGGHAVDRGELGVEGGEEQLLVAEEDRDDDDRGDDADGEQILRRDAQDVAEERASKLRVNERVLLIRATPRANEAVVMIPIAASRADVAPPRGRLDQERREEPPGPGAEVEVPAHQGADDRAAEDGVRQPVPDVAHPPQHDVDAHQPAERADQRGGDQAVAEELVAAAARAACP